ncbi:hypothetical protein RLDS_21430 [Sphingobium lactosutens DS20]|uniref:Uncharacterized protein n=1 Tax=Sphingobium lactosutens DS20 TaxID=1331060 RepID=T0IIZ0_9SPHN|nr:hypothetical protein RLDS_21430 [Sphingobium lactosutens DS20]
MREYRQAGFAPGEPHLANLPLASLHRLGAAFFSGHLVNLPLASLQGAALATTGTAAIEAAARNDNRFFIGFIP